MRREEEEDITTMNLILQYIQKLEKLEELIKQNGIHNLKQQGQENMKERSQNQTVQYRQENLSKLENEIPGLQNQKEYIFKEMQIYINSIQQSIALLLEKQENLEKMSSQIMPNITLQIEQKSAFFYETLLQFQYQTEEKIQESLSQISKIDELIKIQEKHFNEKQSQQDEIQQTKEKLYQNEEKLVNDENKFNSKKNQKQFKQENQNKQINFIGKISQNISLSKFYNFELIYNENFEKILSKIVFEQLSDKIFDTNIDPLLCIGAEKDQIFKVVACDLATEIFQETKNKYLARPSNNGQIFWYNFPDKSFGFSSSEFINLNVCDRENPQDDLRLCLSIQQQNNERRIGNLINQKEIQDYNLRIYMNKQ